MNAHVHVWNETMGGKYMKEGGKVFLGYKFPFVQLKNIIF